MVIEIVSHILQKIQNWVFLSKRNTNQKKRYCGVATMSYRDSYKQWIRAKPIYILLNLYTRFHHKNSI